MEIERKPMLEVKMESDQEGRFVDQSWGSKVEFEQEGKIVD